MRTGEHGESRVERASSGEFTTFSTGASSGCARRYTSLLTGPGPSRGGSGCLRSSWSVSLALELMVGRDFFPSVDSGQMRLHARAPTGTRIEQTEVIFADDRGRDPPSDAAGRNRHHYR